MEKYKFQEETKKSVKENPGALDGGEKLAFDFDSDEEEMNKKLRTPRSEIYLQLFDLVDLLSSTDEEIIEKLKANLDEETASEVLEMSSEELREEIRRSFVEEFESMQIEVKSILKGVLAKCYIKGCDCHAITPQGRILEHFRMGIPMPKELAKGRRILGKYGLECKCVEIYTNCCRVVMKDSSVITINDFE